MSVSMDASMGVNMGVSMSECEFGWDLRMCVCVVPRDLPPTHNDQCEWNCGISGSGRKGW